MNNSIFGSRNILPIAAGFMLMPSFLFAQNEKQVLAIKKESNLPLLNQLKKNLKKQTLTTTQLKKKAKEKGLVFSGEANGQYFELKGFDKKGNPLYYVTTNTGAAVGTSTNKLNSSAGIFNLDGEGMKVHEWDGGGTRVSHSEFGGRAVQKDVPTTASDHATHVAGTMIASGLNGKAKGMASKAFLDTYDWTNDTIEMTEAAINGALVSNHSYGYAGGFAWTSLAGKQGWHWLGEDDDDEYKYYGKYSEIDANWDLIALNAPFYLPVKAAGNPRGSGPETGAAYYIKVLNPDTGKEEWTISNKEKPKNCEKTGFDCINHAALGKNILTVGAAQKILNGYQKPSDVVMASFSGYGPVDDGRIKPDITGIGVDIFSTNNTSNDAYTTMSGTSMASPNVTGSLLLLQEHYRNLNDGNFMRAATLKALAIHTANEAGEHDGPDYASGWGLLNAYKAATTISVKDKYSLIQERTLRNTATDKIKVVASGTEPLAITIAWTDPVNEEIPDGNIHNDRTKALVNDLDIRVKYNGETFYPWKLDPANPSAAATKGDNVVDNVENIVIPNPVAGATYEIEISHKGTLKKNKLVEKITKDENGKDVSTTEIFLQNTTEQNYSLIVSGINNGVQKDLVLNSIVPKVSRAEFTNKTPVSFEIVNRGSQDMTNVKLQYRLVNADENNKVLATGTVSVDDISAGATLVKDINLDLSKSFVNFQIEGTVISDGDEVEVNNKQTTSVYGIIADLTQPKSFHTFGFEDDFDKNGWSAEDTDGDGKTWLSYSHQGFAHSGTNFVINLPQKKGTNDWVFSNPIKLKANTIYRLSFYTRKFQTPEDPIGVYFGSQANSGAMTNVIDAKIIPGIAYNKYVYEFTPTVDGISYFGFNHKVEDTDDAYAVVMDDFRIDHAEGTPWVDFTADKFNPTTFETVSFTNQTSTASTQPVLEGGYEWAFEPNTITFQDGTTKNSENPKVMFNKEGAYKVSLTATNSEGGHTEEKASYIVAKNTPAVASFRASKTAIYQGQSITFTNTSTGNPAPTEFEWSVTPSDGVEFTSGSGATTTNSVIKFGNFGTYTVALKAKSRHNEDIATKTIEVESNFTKVRNLEHTLDKNTKEVTLTWERPIIRETYLEDFNDLVGVPADMKVIDNNGDKNKWGTVATGGVNQTRGILNKSWTNGKAFTADDYLITPKIRKGAEVLKYDVKHEYKERYDVYLVEAPASGVAPTIDEIKAGHKIYTLEGEKGQGKTYYSKEINIKDYADKDFHIVFHHRTQKADNGFSLALDNILVGYDNTIKTPAPGQSEGQSYKALYEEGKVPVSMTDEVMTESVLPENNLVVEFGIVDRPDLTGYQVKRDNVEIKNIDNVETRTAKDTLPAPGTYTYEVFAVYGGTKSEAETEIVSFDTLSANEVSQDNKLKIYQNPSNGLFVVEKSNATSLKIEVYDMSGKLIFKNDFKGNKADLNLTQNPKGVYIIHLVDNNGEKQSAKLIVK